MMWIYQVGLVLTSCWYNVGVLGGPDPQVVSFCFRAYWRGDRQEQQLTDVSFLWLVQIMNPYYWGGCSLSCEDNLPPEIHTCLLLQVLHSRHVILHMYWLTNYLLTHWGYFYSTYVFCTSLPTSDFIYYVHTLFRTASLKHPLESIHIPEHTASGKWSDI